LNIEIGKLLKESKKGVARVYFFDPNASQQNITGPCLIVLDDTAYFCNAQIDELVRKGIIPYEKIPPISPQPPQQPEAKLKDYKEWCKEQKKRLIENPPSDEILREYVPLITQEKLNALLNRIRELIHEMFIYLPAARNTTLRPGERRLIVSEDISRSSFLVNPELPDDYDRSRYVERTFESIFKNSVEELKKLGHNPPLKRIDRISNEVRIDDSSARAKLRLAYEGGGIQEILYLITKLALAMKDEKILIIEEPELHLNPAWCRALFKELMKAAKNNQIIIATHSTEFLYRNEYCRLFNFVGQSDGSVKITEVTKTKELVEVYKGLGVLPSSGGAPNKILIVEGPSDREFVEGIAEKIRSQILNFLVTLGANNYEFVKGLANRIKATLMEPYVIVDADNKNINKYKELAGQGILEKIFIVDPNLEDIYPKSLLFKVLKDKPFNLSDEDLKILQNGQTKQSKALEKLLKPRYGEKWNVTLALAITQSINIEEIQRQKVSEEYRKLAEIIKFIQEVIS
jgi:hypothetical protein